MLAHNPQYKGAWSIYAVIIIHMYYAMNNDEMIDYSVNKNIILTFI